MGYSTDFMGHIALSRKLTMAEAKQLLQWNEEPEGIPNAPSNTNYMQWVPATSLDAIVWDGGEKFYDYDKWMVWLCKWLDEQGINAGGELVWSGESTDDVGVIKVKNCQVEVIKGARYSGSNFNPLTLDALAKMALDSIT